MGSIELRAAAQQALEALEALRLGMPDSVLARILDLRIDALRAALAEPVQEPVRCPLCNYQYGHQIGCENNPVDIALAAAQPRQQAEPVQYLVYWEYKHVDDGPETWRRVMPRTGQTLETALAEIQGYRRGLKRLYEVRALCAAAPPQRPAEPVGVVTSMVKGGVTWRRWPADMPDGTRLFSEVQP